MFCQMVLEGSLFIKPLSTVVDCALLKCFPDWLSIPPFFFIIKLVFRRNFGTTLRTFHFFVPFFHLIRLFFSRFYHLKKLLYFIFFSLAWLVTFKLSLLIRKDLTIKFWYRFPHRLLFTQSSLMLSSRKKWNTDAHKLISRCDFTFLLRLWLFLYFLISAIRHNSHLICISILNLAH